MVLAGGAEGPAQASLSASLSADSQGWRGLLRPPFLLTSRFPGTLEDVCPLQNGLLQAWPQGASGRLCVEPGGVVGEAIPSRLCSPEPTLAVHSECRGQRLSGPASSEHRWSRLCGCGKVEEGPAAWGGSCWLLLLLVSPLSRPPAH